MNIISITNKKFIDMKLINKTTNTILAQNLEIADTPAKRMKGLLGKKSLQTGEGLHIIPCNSIHSFFMKFKFDAVFIDKKNIILDLAEKIPPGRVKFCFGAYSVVELPEGTIAITKTRPGNEISFLK